MDYTPVVRASEETNQNKPGAVVSVVGTFGSAALMMSARAAKADVLESPAERRD
jgi:hypothetical protein